MINSFPKYLILFLLTAFVISTGELFVEECCENYAVENHAFLCCEPAVKDVSTRNSLVTPLHHFLSLGLSVPLGTKVFSHSSPGNHFVNESISSYSIPLFLQSSSFLI